MARRAGPIQHRHVDPPEIERVACREDDGGDAGVTQIKAVHRIRQAGGFRWRAARARLLRQVESARAACASAENATAQRRRALPAKEGRTAMPRSLACLAFLMALSAAPGFAQDRQRAPRATAPATGCTTAAPTTPATPPQGGRAGSGDMGTTAWSGGTGGSHIGTTPAGPTPASPNAHPETAQGLDPIRPRGEPRPSPC